MAPLPLSEFTIAFALPSTRVLLVSPETLEPGGPPCEEMDLLHEAGHAWLHARWKGSEPLPLWVEEGIAGAAAMPGPAAREWCRRLLRSVREAGIDPFTPEEILGLRSIGDAARIVEARAPCADRPHSLVPVFHAHAESLIAFLLDGEDDPQRPARFRAWLDGVLEGKPADPARTAEALGYPDPKALLDAKDGAL